VYKRPFLSRRRASCNDAFTDSQLHVLRSVAFTQFKYEVNVAGQTNVLKLVDVSTKNKDGRKYGTVVWTQHEVEQLLASMGLPRGSALSVLVVETFPQITNSFEHVSRLDRPHHRLLRTSCLTPVPEVCPP
jgi:hypothetical protein